MRTFAISILVSVCLTIAAQAEEEKGPILHLTFDEGAGTVAKDASGNGRDATIKTDAKGSPVDVADIWVKEGKVGGAIRLDGENMYLALPPTGLDREDKPFTFEAWIDGYGTLLANGDTAATFARQWMMQFASSPGKITYCLGKSQVKGSPWAGLECEKAPKGWTHIAATYDGEGELAFYVNGKPAGSVVWEAFVPCEPCDRYALGAWFHNGKWVGPFTGMLDEVKLYDYVRSPEAIASEATAADAK